MTVQKNTPPEPNDYRNDFVGLLRALFKRKRLIIFGVLITTILSLVLAMVVPKTYRSEGFFQFSDPTKEKNNPLFSVASQLLESSKLVVLSQLKDLGMLRVLKDLNIELTQPDHFHVMTIQQFKKYSSAFGNYYEFLGFVRRNKLLEDEEFESLKGLINTTGQFSKLILEIYALSRDDLKNVGQTLLQEKNYVVGVELQIDAHQPATAQRFLNALGAFIRYSIFVERFNEYTSLNLNESQILASRYDNYILSNRAVLE
ncbi:MAG: hypothetical protein GY940_38880, partial [bacterium]|nr:hypothetical protein [bacterium]